MQATRQISICLSDRDGSVRERIWPLGEAEIPAGGELFVVALDMTML
jgi:hypothetical protein